MTPVVDRISASTPNHLRSGVVMKAAIVAILVSVLAVPAFADDAEISWSLSPKTEKFPCDAAIITQDGLHFVKDMVITCTGKTFMVMRHGDGFSHYVSLACGFPLGMVLSGKENLDAHPDNLLYVAQKDCHT